MIESQIKNCKLLKTGSQRDDPDFSVFLSLTESLTELDFVLWEPPEVGELPDPVLCEEQPTPALYDPVLYEPDLELTGEFQEPVLLAAEDEFQDPVL